MYPVLAKVRYDRLDTVEATIEQLITELLPTPAGECRTSPGGPGR
jgi:hypothetical protein